MNVSEKSRLMSLLLTVFFGPIGAFYGSITAGIILLVLAISTTLTIIGPIFFWIISIFISDRCVVKHNKSVRRIFDLLEKTKD